MPVFSKPPKELRLYQFENIATALAIDLVSALATSAFVAPIVAIIDKSIIANASGKEPLKQGLKNGFHMLLTRPFLFARQPIFFPVFAIFTATYSVANTVETACIAAPVNPTVPKFASSSIVNICLCAWKDSLFTKWFGTVTPKPIPVVSYAMFAVRDSMTVGTSFLGPPVASKYLQDDPIKMSKKTADVTAQLALPCLVQFVSTPIHLLSLDLYNNPNASIRDRWNSGTEKYWGSAWGRVFRTLPGFGVGGIVNRYIRVKLNQASRNTIGKQAS